MSGRNRLIFSGTCSECNQVITMLPNDCTYPDFANGGVVVGFSGTCPVCEKEICEDVDLSSHALTFHEPVTCADFMGKV